MVLAQWLASSSHGSGVFLGVPPLDICNEQFPQRQTMPPLASTLAVPDLWASLRPPVAQVLPDLDGVLGECLLDGSC